MHCRLLLAFASYFGLGAYYNYSTYGATGVDLIPYVLLYLFYAAYSVYPRLTAPSQTPRFLERSAVYAPRCHFTPSVICEIPTPVESRLHCCVIYMRYTGAGVYICVVFGGGDIGQGD